MKTALILIDYENEWINPDSDYYIGDITVLIEKTNKLINFARDKGYKIIFTRHIEKDSDSAFIEGSEGVEIINYIQMEEEDVLITKYKISPFYNTNLSDELNGYGSIIVAGILTNLCVRMTVEEAYDRDFAITLVSDCSASFDKKAHEFTLSDLKNTRPEINVITLEEMQK